MLQVSNLHHHFGDQTVFKGITWQVGDHDRVGLVGNNGTGKTTLMRIIMGEIQAETADITFSKGWSPGYLPQDGLVHDGTRLFEEVKSVFADILALEKRSHELQELMTQGGKSDETHLALAEEYAEAMEELARRGGFEIESEIARVLSGLGFSQDDFEKPCDTFSGGWQMRIALAKILLQRPSVLLLDEPTNYLDIEARTFLLEYLQAYPYSVVLVSHDRYFLDMVVTKISEIHDGTITDYHCNYSKFLLEREERHNVQREAFERQQKEIERITQFIERFRYKESKAKQVQSRIKMLEKIEKIELPAYRKKIHFHFPQPERSGKLALETKDLACGYPERTVLPEVSLQIQRGEKIALVGVNGAGKTTLLRTLAGRLQPRSGWYEMGHNVSFDYFAQDVQRSLDPNATVYDTVSREAPFELVPKLRTMLGAFLFSGSDIDKHTSVLSGGERNRLALCRMLLRPSNLLLMDEPTNHLDIEAKDVLLEALQRFEGTVIFVSHDRYFLDKLATHVIHLNKGEVYEYPGNYPDFLIHMREREGRIGPSAEELEKQRKEEIKKLDKQDRVERFKQEKKQKRELDRLRKQITGIEEELESLNANSERLLHEMAKPEYSTNFKELERLGTERDEVLQRISTLEAEWESLMEQEDALNEG